VTTRYFELFVEPLSAVIVGAGVRDDKCFMCR
jgi:hypothetical protein